MAWLLLLALVGACTANTDWLEVTNSWDGGFEGNWVVKADHGDLNGWKVTIKFDKNIDKLEVWKATIVSQNGRDFVLQGIPEYANIAAGSQLTCHFVARAAGSQPAHAFFNVEGGDGSGGGSVVTSAPSTGTGTDGGGTGGDGNSTDAGSTDGGNPGTVVSGNVPTGPVSNMRHDYGEAMKLSILFYDAQRSGRLPAGQPISWRGDSCVNDKGNGRDLSGGWYDAGDHVKFNFPMSFSTWVLNWGFIKFADAYAAKGQTDMMCKSVRWPLEYFLKCWNPQSNELWVQVGDGAVDHGFWGRPENMPGDMWRPAYKVDYGNPGSDIASNVASAFATGYIIFRDICGDNAFADKLLAAGKSVYDFAHGTNKKYSDSVGAANPYYTSNSIDDEKTVAGAMMYWATNDAKYLNDAKATHVAGAPWSFSWDDTIAAGDVLLYMHTKEDQYKQKVVNFINDWKPGGGITYTPCGLAWRNQWGSNRYAGGAAFIATMAAEEGINSDEYKKWAMTQINYLLGDNKQHMSFEVGFGNNFPKKAHHRGSSCPTWTNNCDGNSGGDNPNQLNGALVGGPDQWDNYEDKRDDFVKNEVACDYNAGFQGACAGLYHFAVNNNLPASPGPKC